MEAESRPRGARWFPLRAGSRLRSGASRGRREPPGGGTRRRRRLKVSSARSGCARSAWKRSARSEGLWQKRIANAREQILDAARSARKRRSADLAALENLPAEIEQRRMKSARCDCRRRARAGESRRRSGSGRDGAERPREGLARGAGAACRGARGARAQRGAARSGARAPRRDRRAIRDQLDCTPEDCLALAGLKPGAPIPPLAEVEARLLKARRRPRAAGRRQSAAPRRKRRSLPPSSRTWSAEKADLDRGHRAAARKASPTSIARAASACSPPSTR